MNRDERAKYGPIIRNLRINSGIDQETLAEMTGLTRRTVGSIERGDSIAQPAVLDKLLRALNVPVEQTDPDVTAFLTVIEPLLQGLSVARRPQVMRDLTAQIVAALSMEAREASVTPFRWPVSDPADELPAVADSSAIEEPGENSI